ncbi:MAG TPA: LacI family DNA-binding transcriptional regulator [Burkholderiaceae bacterium]|nr:LacI family DNA-binding transcriptional regulator [Burkholderiaceae bacterium]
MTTSRDIARRAGVSQTTVSRVLQASPNVSEPVRERVRRAMAEMNYRPNARARAMKMQRTGTFGVLVARITNPFYPQLLDRLTHAMGEHGRRAVVWDAESSGEQAAIEALHEGAVDGLVHGAATDVTPELQALLDRQAPIVFVNRRIPGDACDQVVSDNLRGASRLADYFVDHGRRRIAIVGGPQQISTFREREAGFVGRLRERGVALPTEVARVPAASYHTGQAAMRSLLEGAARPDAVFCVNDALALGAIDAARIAGVAIPAELWVAGYDDVDMASWRAFDLTTVRQPMQQMARMAVELLLQRLREPGREGRVHQVRGDLVVRGSTAGAPAAAAG